MSWPGAQERRCDKCNKYEKSMLPTHPQQAGRSPITGPMNAITFPEKSVLGIITESCFLIIQISTLTLTPPTKLDPSSSLIPPTKLDPRTTLYPIMLFFLHGKWHISLFIVIFYHTHYMLSSLRARALCSVHCFIPSAKKSAWPMGGTWVTNPWAIFWEISTFPEKCYLCGTCAYSRLHFTLLS